MLRLPSSARRTPKFLLMISGSGNFANRTCTRATTKHQNTNITPEITHVWYIVLLLCFSSKLNQKINSTSNYRKGSRDWRINKNSNRAFIYVSVAIRVLVKVSVHFFFKARIRSTLRETRSRNVLMSLLMFRWC